MQSVGDFWLWGMFFLLLGGAFSLDLRRMLQRPIESLPIKVALWRSIGWIAVALFFLMLFWLYLVWQIDFIVATHKAAEFFTAYVLEKSLSIDNLFVILLILQTLKIPYHLQRRVLFYGMLGAVVFRLLLIFSGIWILSVFNWVIYVFGLFVLYTGLQILRVKPYKQKNPCDGLLYRLVANRLPLLDSLRDDKFFVWENKKYWATPLFFALVLVEISDLIFALDSIPAVFAITQDPFIAFSSNIFAVAALRALYFLLAQAAEKISGLQFGVGLVLVLIGLKMLFAKWITITPVWMLFLVITILFFSGYIGKKFKKNQ